MPITGRPRNPQRTLPYSELSGQSRFPKDGWPWRLNLSEHRWVVYCTSSAAAPSRQGSRSFVRKQPGRPARSQPRTCDRNSPPFDRRQPLCALALTVLACTWPSVRPHSLTDPFDDHTTEPEIARFTKLPGPDTLRPRDRPAPQWLRDRIQRPIAAHLPPNAKVWRTGRRGSGL